ncbi:hypothetical protein [Nostoc sp. PCC 9305]|uniref:hypothetical protein n=1 Tax=Nostoc sp. PCC 9305 TaxID=296636 RepID=UPI0039C75508
MLKVTYLPVPTTESDLRELFSSYGEIEIDIPIEVVNGNSIAYVNLGNNEDEKNAIKELNRLKWRNKYIRVSPIRGKRSLGQSGDKNNKPENQDTNENEESASQFLLFFRIKYFQKLSMTRLRHQDYFSL